MVILADKCQTEKLHREMGVISSYAKVLTTNFYTYFVRVCVSASRTAFDITPDMGSLCSSWGIRGSRRRFLGHHNTTLITTWVFILSLRTGPFFVVFIPTRDIPGIKGWTSTKRARIPNTLVE